MALSRALKSLISALGVILLVAPGFAKAAFLEKPQDLTLVGGIYTNDTTPRFTWHPADGATWYEYRFDESSYIGLSNVFGITLATQDDGWHIFAVRAHNNSGSVSSEASIVYEIDTQGPTVPLVTPSTADEDEEVTISVDPSGEADVTGCDLYVEGDFVGDMNEDDGEWELDYTFTQDDTYSVYAKCTDGDGNTTTGPTRIIDVDDDNNDSNNDDDDNDVDGDDDAEEGDLIKMECDGYTPVNDPCTAVYYWGTDNRRHPFPTESTYFSWYNDFDDVIEVSDDFMEDISLGDNVTYKPGTVVVKFDTADDVYAVAEGGILRHYLTPSLVSSDYGSDWADDDLVSVPDVFFNDYTIGSDIDSSSDYDPDDAEDGVEDIDDNF